MLQEKKGCDVMAQWTNINVNKNKIAMENERSVLIKMPEGSLYKGYSFWHIKKLIRDGRTLGDISIGFNEGFLFRLKKYGKGKYNKLDVLHEVVIDASELIQVFKQIDTKVVRGDI